VTAFVSETQVVNGTTVRFVLLEPNSAFPHLVTAPAYFPVSPNCFPADQIDPFSICGGIGPYHVASWDQGIALYLEAVPTYNGPPPKTPTVAVRYFDGAQTQRQALEDGDVDVAWRTLEASDYQELGDDPNYDIVESGSSFIRYLCFNTTTPPFDNPGVRTALAAAVDREPIGQQVYSDTLSALYSMVPAGMWSHRDSFFDLYGRRNLTVTRSRLQLAGYSEANKLEMDLWYPLAHYGDEEPTLAARLAADLEESGMVAVSLHSTDWSTYVGKLGEGTMPAFLLGWYPDYLDPDNYTWPFAHSSSSPGLGIFYNNPTMDSLLEAGRTATPIQGPAREAIYVDIQDLWVEEAPTIPLLQGSYMAVARKGIRDALISLQGTLAYSRIWREPVADITLTQGDDPDPVVVGGTLTYTLALVNNGPEEATGVILTDTLPGNAILIWASPGCTEAGGVVTCEPGPLAAGEGATLTIRVTAEAVGQLINLAEVAAQELDPDPTNNVQTEYTEVSPEPPPGPVVAGITPDSGVNSTVTPIAIQGSNFQDGASVSLGAQSLGQATFVNVGRLLSSVPGGLAPGTRDLTVTNPAGQSGSLAKAFTVLSPGPPSLTNVSPGQGPNDIPVTLDILGANFAPEVTASLRLGSEDIPLWDLVFVDSTRLQAVVPISTVMGLYDLVVVNPDSQSATLPGAYEALEPAASNDLYALPTDLWIDPPSIHAHQTLTLGLTLRRLGGQADLHDVDVRFYLEGGEPAFTATAPVLPPNAAVTVTAEWVPSTAGEFTLYAQLDPQQEIPENDEDNNLIQRFVTILPPLPDTTPPTVNSFSINNPGILYTENPNVRLNTVATDEAGGSGVAYLLFVEYYFNQSKNDWEPVQQSTWLSYEQASSRYPWQLLPRLGVHYLQVWAADRDGNISPSPGTQMINFYTRYYRSIYLHQTHVYRQPMEAGQSLRLYASTGYYDDSYVCFRLWAPDGSLAWARCLHRGSGSAILLRDVKEGIYQIEARGYQYRFSKYKLDIIPYASSTARASDPAVTLAANDEQPVVPPSSVPSRHIGLPSPISAKRAVYLPMVVRGYGP
jgi:peptide/nickel transport system substrate-binding protein